MQELPEIGEIVLGTVTKVSDHGAYVTLDEYNGIQGFLHISEIAPGWVRNVSRFVREGEKKVLLVKKVRSDRSEIDLSLKQISKDQKKKKLLDVKRYEKGTAIIEEVKNKANLTKNEVEKLEDELFSKYDSIFDAIIDIAGNGIEVVNDIKFPKKILSSLEEISSKIKLPSVEIRGILEITSDRSNGVEIIKKTLLDVISNYSEDNIKITYLGAPKYRLSVVSSDFKTAEKMLKPLLSNIQKSIEKKKGTYKFIREDSKKKREG